MRELLHALLLTAAVPAATASASVVLQQDDIRAVERPLATLGGGLYGGNRAPLQPSALLKLPPGAIEPRGWLRKQLRLQADGFFGQLGTISRFLRKEGNAWLDPQQGEHGWEEVPYWLKGYANLAFVLHDEVLLAEARSWVEAVFESQQGDGWFGPEANRSRLDGKPDLWPNMIMLFCLQDYFEWSGDERVLALMTRYFGLLATIPDEDFLPGYWDRMRGGDLLYSVHWLYNRTGQEELLELASKVHRNTARWDQDVINWHNVNIAQAFGEPATWWRQSRDEADLQAAYRNWTRVRELYGQVPGGMFGADENARPGRDDPRQAVETCGMVEEMLSDETLLAITGDLVWADRCEDVAFNALPAALTADLKALRYLTAPNLVLSDQGNKAPGLQNGGAMLLFDPHGHRCCQHNWGHGWPYYAQHLWLATPDRGLAAALYGASVVRARVADDREVAVEQRTHYPFDEAVELVVRTSQPVRFPLYLRVPGWCRAPKLEVAGRGVAVDAGPRQYIRVLRTWSDGDRVRLVLPMDIAIRRWEANHGSVSVDRGPLTYALEIGEEHRRAGGTDAWPAWEIHPTTGWNYALVLDESDPAPSFQVERHPWPADDRPFTLEGTPLRLRGRRVAEWTLDRHGLVAELQDSPVRSAEPEEDITLVPMGAARLRVSAFPVAAGEGAPAHTWRRPRLPELLPYAPSASHCWPADTVEALCDQLLPASSGDQDIPRLTWWDHRGTQEWVEYHFQEPRMVSGVSVYWFDDTGVGQCRIPAGWRVLYHEGGAWRPVPGPGAPGVAIDDWSTVAFEPVRTDGLRLEVLLQPEFSGGILEWQVLED